MNSDGKLSTPQYWSSWWANAPGIHDIRLDPKRYGMRDIHQLFVRCLPVQEGARFLEIGCYPGQYMWYFHNFFQCSVTGIEYVDWCCDRTRENLTTHHVPGEVIQADLFTYKPPSSDMLWDVVASFGLVEHFIDTALVIKKHCDLLRPNGHLVITLPNLHGIYGKIMRTVNHESFIVHNPLSYDDIVTALDKIGGFEIKEGGYYEHVGFWSSGIYPKLIKAGRLPYMFVRSPLWILERLGRLLPNSATLSPTIAIVAKRVG
jgi:SAM-dependent methyltransferase